jgi:hypothetical protein
MMDISDSMLRSPSKSLRKLPWEKDFGIAQRISESRSAESVCE